MFDWVLTPVGSSIFHKGKKLATALMTKSSNRLELDQTKLFEFMKNARTNILKENFTLIHEI